MEDPRPKLQDALKEAMKTKNNQRRDVIRFLQSVLKQVEVDSRKELTAEDAVEILQKEVKKRRETIADLEKAGRADQIGVEQAELAIINEFLPRQLSPEELAAIVKAVIAEVGATSPKDMGKVMNAVMPRVKGLADGKLVNQVVREQLSA